LESNRRQVLSSANGGKGIPTSSRARCKLAVVKACAEHPGWSRERKDKKKRRAEKVKAVTALDCS
jgi:hypothetical protein